MKCWSYDDVETSSVITLSEDEIYERFYPYWKKQMIKKFGINFKDSREDCITDWSIVNWAWEVEKRL
jgi:hypothetical protein